MSNEPIQNAPTTRILFIAMHRPRRSPGQRFRFEQYLGHLEQNGVECDVSYLISEEDDRVVYAPGRYMTKLGIFLKSVAIRLRDVADARRYDIVFIFREALMVNSAIIEVLLALRGPKIVFDFDDAVWLQPVSDANRRLGFLRGGPSKIPAILKRSDLVLAGNRYLADYASQWNSAVHVIPTTLDVDLYVPAAKDKDDGVICIGWTGSPSTVGYFDALTEPLAEIRRRYGARVRFELYGEGAYRNPALGLVGRPWREASEIADTRAFDIGLMPLPDDPWTRGKCGFKALLYMALGIPPVVAPVGVNTEIVENDVSGLIARDAQDWVLQLARLIEQPDLRQRLGRNGRAVVAERYSFQSQRDRYLSLLLNLVGRAPPQAR